MKFIIYTCLLYMCVYICVSVCVYKKAFLSYHCKEIEENNRMGKTKDLFKKIRNTKGTFHAKMGSIIHILLYPAFLFRVV